MEHNIPTKMLRQHFLCITSPPLQGLQRCRCDVNGCFRTGGAIARYGSRPLAAPRWSRKLELRTLLLQKVDSSFRSAVRGRQAR